jgi:hypothetical protein
MSTNWMLPALMLAGYAGVAQAAVVADSQFRVQSDVSTPSTYMFTVEQAFAFSDYTSIWVAKLDQQSTSTLAPISWNLDIEADYYLVRPGDEFTLANVSAGLFQPLFTTDHPYELAIPLTGDFYLGVATTGPVPFDSPRMTPYNPVRNVWGWAHFSNGPTGLSLLGSAMAYGESGIVVGTLTAVPELNAGVLMPLGLLGVAAAVRFKRRRAVA